MTTCCTCVSYLRAQHLEQLEFSQAFLGEMSVTFTNLIKE